MCYNYMYILSIYVTLNKLKHSFQTIFWLLGCDSGYCGIFSILILIILS